MLHQKMPPTATATATATATTGTKASWNYQPAQITHARRFLAESKSNTFANALL
jgi:hypothetical protein